MTLALGIGLIGGGYLALYSAIRNRSPLDVLRQSLTSSPAARPPVSGFAPGTKAGGSSGDTGGGGGGGSW